MTPHLSLVAAGLWLSLLTACAAPRAELTPEMLARMQREARAEIYDHENDLSIAEAKQDEVRLRTEALRRQLDTLSDTMKRLQARLVKANAGDRANALDKTGAARRTYLQAQLKLADESRSAADAQVEAASARLEQTRQRQLVRTGRALATSLAPFDAAVLRVEKRQKEIEKREADLGLETEKAYDGWKSAEDDYARATGDYDTGIWLD